MTQRHLVSVWNPSYEADAMEQHLHVLLTNAARHRAGECEEDDVYVWWGKIRSLDAPPTVIQNRPSPPLKPEA